jgi:hypothetical protein
VDAVSVGAVPGRCDMQSCGVHAVAVRECQMKLRAVSNPQIANAHIHTIPKHQSLELPASTSKLISELFPIIPFLQ